MFIAADYNCILWDFDGVLMDSMPVRDDGFTQVLADYPTLHVEELMKYHRANGGLSRYVKFRYFFEQIRNESVTEEQIMQLSERFSTIMLKSLSNKALLINDSIQFVKTYHKTLPMHIVSGSDGDELRFLCQQLKIDQYFKSIHGSPIQKKELVHKVLQYYQYAKKGSVLIGDSINDYEAAQANDIAFCGYNNTSLTDCSTKYIFSFNALK
jgi:phosphoglycolate phosphatase-like HAD superfamily hydrolase